ncbi:MAG TPA: DMT family transporter [Candidatus Bathyarchaeota archaeon]|nr:DMT family transporter [Candidatus Bathyarchaeota archaeon]
MSDEKKAAVLFTIIASSLWGTSFPAIKLGLQYMDAYTFVFWRFFFASLTMLAVMLLTKNFSFNFKKKRLLLFLGVTNGTAYLLQYVGMVSAFASHSSLFVNLSVVWVALLSPVVLKENIGRKKLAGVIASLLGVVLVTTNLDFGSLGAGEITGDLIVIGAGVLWAVFIVYNKPLVSESKNTIQSMTWLLLFTMLPLLPVAPFSAENFLHLTWEAWAAIIYTAIFCWVAPYYLWLKGLKNVSPVTSAVILLNEVIVAVIISIIFLGEVMTAASAVGAVFIILAILAVSYE